MYIRTPHALVWVESPLEQSKSVPNTGPIARSQSQIRWAKKPLNTAKGRFVAVRQSGGKLELGCMVNNRLTWLQDPHQVLSERQLKNWLREGF